MDPLTIAKIFGPSFAGWWLNRGANSDASKAQAGQLALSQALMQMTQQRHNVEQPFRKNLFSALKARQGRSQPRFNPGPIALSNPYKNVRRAGLREKGGQLGPGMPGLAKALNLARRNPTVSARGRAEGWQPSSGGAAGGGGGGGGGGVGGGGGADHTSPGIPVDPSIIWKGQ